MGSSDGIDKKKPLMDDHCRAANEEIEDIVVGENGFTEEKVEMKEPPRKQRRATSKMKQEIPCFIPSKVFRLEKEKVLRKLNSLNET